MGWQKRRVTRAERARESGKPQTTKAEARVQWPLKYLDCGSKWPHSSNHHPFHSAQGPVSQAVMG